MKDVMDNVCYVGETVKVFDNHYGNFINSEVLPLRKNGLITDLVGLDLTGNIISLEHMNGEWKFNNLLTYGSVIGGKLSGWCFDRDNITIDGFETSGYYREIA